MPDEVIPEELDCPLQSSNEASQFLFALVVAVFRFMYKQGVGVSVVFGLELEIRKVTDLVL